MLRTSRLTDTLRGRGKAVAFVGAAAALAGVGTASAASLTSAAAHAPATPLGAAKHAPALHTPATESHTLEPRAAAPPAPAAHRGASARKSAGRHQDHAAGNSRPYEIYDSVTPTAIPAGHKVAAYATGNYAASPSEVAGRGRVLWIDTSGSDPKASALDVEPGDATPGIAASWAWHKLRADARGVAILYTMRSEWPAVQAAVATLPQHMRSHVRYWIADPTGVPHIVPGASATQWYWGSNYDITTAKPGF